MSRDAIIDEVRAIRDAIAREHNYDVDSIFHMLREREATSGRPHVTLPPRLSEAERPRRADRHYPTMTIAIDVGGPHDDR